MPSATVRDFGQRWVARKQREVKASTHKFYETGLRTFLKALGKKADAPIVEINREDILDWRDGEAARVSPATVNHNLKFVRMLFAGAKREGLVADNPAEDVPIIRKESKSTRRPFTQDELRKILQHADGEWKSMVLFGLYTGQRLGDIAQLTWGQIDLENSEIRIETGKTGRFQKIPIPSPLRRHLESLPTPEHEQVPLHPRADDIVATQGKTGSLSNQFQKILARAGIAEKKPHRKTGSAPGRSGQRAQSKVSFHSLRHTTTSLLKNAGVSPAIAEEFVGHDSAEMNRVYTHIELESMRKAAEQLPDITGEG